MTADFVAILILCVLGLVAHAARTYNWLEWVLRSIYVFTVIVELYLALIVYPAVPGNAPSPWATIVVVGMAILTAALLFKPLRIGFSGVFTALNVALNGQLFLPLLNNPSKALLPMMPPESDSPSLPARIAGKVKLGTVWTCNRIFVPESIPHMNGLYIYVTVLGAHLANIDLDSFQFPTIPIPLPVPMEALVSYNFIGLILLSICGAGIFIARKPREVLVRLGIVKPKGWQIGVGLMMIPVTFAYDYLWSLYTHSQPGELGSKLSMYNSGTFTAMGAGPAVILALMTGICAGIGEETLIRGALQPVIGIALSGFLHGVLHGQFVHAPIFILQVACWSMLMGIVRYYTNTSTTIITHATYNFLTTFLIAFNPP